ncbi:MAG: aminodeoxychorismate synthase component I [Pseudomonadota bacterium]
MPPEVILHDASANQWLRFSRLRRVKEVWDLAGVIPALEEVERAVEGSGLWAAGFLAYEAAPAFDPALAVREPDPDLPLLWFGLFEPPEPFDLPAPLEHESVAPASWTPTADRAGYDNALARIKDHIAAGNTYQVNYTLRLRSPFSGDPWALFLRLAHAQKARYAAWCDTGRFAVCSASPELFFVLSDGRLTSKPMKGTAGRGRTLPEDQGRARWLHRSVKNRAENVMIVDMIRNDMGRVAETGSVEVPRLFEVERYPTVWQMTTTVTARTTASLSSVFSALFPCASITGAPKCETMRIISQLETTPRGVYCGSIGFAAPGRRAQFNVAIRTVVADREKQTAEYGVGGGIVWDSDFSEEFEECRIKARVLTAPQRVFSLLETLRWTPDEGFFLLEYHLERLRSSAAYFGFPLDEDALTGDLAKKSRGFSGPRRVRVLVDEKGGISLEDAPLPEPDPGPVRLAIAPGSVDSADVFLFHKTTRRGVYEAARANAPEADDVIMVNERGEVTETTIANLVVEKNGRKTTPPVSSGLLAGTLRQLLLDQGEIEEKTLFVENVKTADALYCINSVRGIRKAVLERED